MTNYRHFIILMLGWGGGIRTPECMDQNHVPYHLATPQDVPDYTTEATESQRPHENMAVIEAEEVEYM